MASNIEDMDIDDVLFDCVDEFSTNFSRLKQYAPGRITAQERYCYHILMKKLANVWSIEEDKKLVRLMANQDETINYLSVSKYFPGKDRIHLRERYLYLVKWMKLHPNLDIAFASSHGAYHSACAQVSNSASKKRKNKSIQPEDTHKRSKTVSIGTSEHVLEETTEELDVDTVEESEEDNVVFHKVT